MTVEELLERKRGLLAARRVETDVFSLFFLNEELADLNARLRALRPAPRWDGAGRAAADVWSREDWPMPEQGEEPDAARSVYTDTVRDAAAVLTKRQMELFERWWKGESVTQLAKCLGVNKSTVSRTLARGRARLRVEAERRARARGTVTRERGDGI